MWPPIIFLHWEEVGFTVLTLGLVGRSEGGMRRVRCASEDPTRIFIFSKLRRNEFRKT